MLSPTLTLGTVLRWLFIAGCIGLFVGYVLWQSRIFITGPVLAVHTPPPATTTEATVTIAGNAENIVWITLNGRAIVTTPDGEFKERVILEPGYTIVQLEAADRFGRTVRRTFPVVPLGTASSSINEPNFE